MVSKRLTCILEVILSHTHALLLGDLFELESHFNHTRLPVHRRNPFTNGVEAHSPLGRDAGASSLSFKAIDRGKSGQRHDEQ